MSSREFAEWAAYLQIEPFGEIRDDMRSGMLGATIANSVRDPKKKAGPFKPEEFMLKTLEGMGEDDAPDTDMMRAKVAMINRMLGGRDMRTRNGHAG